MNFPNIPFGYRIHEVTSKRSRPKHVAYRFLFQFCTPFIFIFIFNYYILFLLTFPHPVISFPYFLNCTVSIIDRRIFLKERIRNHQGIWDCKPSTLKPSFLKQVLSFRLALRSQLICISTQPYSWQTCPHPFKAIHNENKHTTTKKFIQLNYQRKIQLVPLVALHGTHRERLRFSNNFMVILLHIFVNWWRTKWQRIWFCDRWLFVMAHRAEIIRILICV